MQAAKNVNPKDNVHYLTFGSMSRKYKKIMVLLEPTSEKNDLENSKILQQVEIIAKTTKAEIMLVCTIGQVNSCAKAYASLVNLSITDSLKQMLYYKLIKEVSNYNIPKCKLLVKEGRPERVLSDLAKAHSCNLIVVSHKKHKLISKLYGKRSKNVVPGREFDVLSVCVN